MVFDQYDGNDKIVDHVVYKKGSQTATSYSNEEGRTEFTIDLPKETSSSTNLKGISLNSAVSKIVDTVVAENTLTSTTKKCMFMKNLKVTLLIMYFHQRV